MTGNLSSEFGMRSAESESGVRSLSRISWFKKFCTPHSAFCTQRGFSLLELMIAMFIVIILLSIAVPTYERSVRQARETVLKENLWQMRRAIDQYTADKGKLPQNIDSLVEGKYLRETPIDPILEKAEWDEVQGDDPNSSEGGQGLKDVRSLAGGEDSNGTPFDKY